jgi:ABC-type transport system involved in cytochrome c biogenesis ATPase subunit
MTVEENIMTVTERGSWLWQGGRKAAEQRVTEILTETQLLDKRHERAVDLAYAERKFLSLARIMASEAKLWLLDEPLSPLDAHWRGQVLDIMAGHLAGGGLILAAVHDPLPVAAVALEIAP